MIDFQPIDVLQRLRHKYYVLRWIVQKHYYEATCGLTSYVRRVNGEIHKTIYPEALKKWPYLLQAECEALKRLADYDVAPKLIEVKGRRIIMSDCGKMVTMATRPADWDSQARHIVETLRKVNIRHGDIKVKNLLVADGKLRLVDYGFASIDDKLPHPVPFWYVPTRNDLTDIMATLSGGCSNELPLIQKELSSLPQWTAYHRLPFYDVDYIAQRNDLSSRLDLFKSSGYDFTGKKGLDIGCSLGALSFALEQNFGCTMLGIERDRASVKIANSLARIYGMASSFTEADAITQVHDMAQAGKRTDFALWLACSMWILQQKGISGLADMCQNVSMITDTCFLETSLGDGGAGKAMKTAGFTTAEIFADFVCANSRWSSWKLLGTLKEWHDRPLMLFTR